MARRPRLVILNYPYHVLIRGTGGQAVFMDDEDRRVYREILGACVLGDGVDLHAWALLVDTVHLIATPRRDAALAQVVQALGRQYVRRFNLRHGRSGTLWEGRFRSSLIQDDPYLLIVQRHVETAPVRERLADRADEYPWSSHRHHLGLTRDPGLTPHAEYWRLGNTPFEREAAYRQRFEGRPELPDARLAQLLRAGHPVAGDAFLDRMTQQTGIDLHPRRVGRPRRDPAQLTGSLPSTSPAP
jgi:putative transposase